MDTESTSYKRWRTMSLSRRLVALVPPLCIGGAAGVVMVVMAFIASTPAARIAAFLAVLAVIQATRDYSCGHPHRDIVLMAAAMTAGGTIKPLAVEPLHWQLAILLALLGAPFAGYGIRHRWDPQAVDGGDLWFVGVVPLFSIHLYLSMSWPSLATQISYVSRQGGYGVAGSTIDAGDGRPGLLARPNEPVVVTEPPPQALQSEQAAQTTARARSETESGWPSTNRSIKRWKAYGG